MRQLKKQSKIFKPTSLKKGKKSHAYVQKYHGDDIQETVCLKTFVSEKPLNSLKSSVHLIFISFYSLIQ